MVALLLAWSQCRPRTYVSNTTSAHYRVLPTRIETLDLRCRWFRLLPVIDLAAVESFPASSAISVFSVSVYTLCLVGLS